MSKEESKLKKLADLKMYLERRVAELQQETGRLTAMIEVVDEILAERSFRKIELAKHVLEEPVATSTFQNEGAIRTFPLTTTDGVHLADLHVHARNLSVVPDPDLKFDINSPPFKAFLIGRILDPMQVKDSEVARTSQLQPEDVLSYTVEQEGGYLKLIDVRNYGDERRLLELRNAIRWTLRRLHEKSLSTTKS